MDGNPDVPLMAGQGLEDQLGAVQAASASARQKLLQAQAQAARGSIPASAIEKEFIYNLQQQVYFLELQGRLLREKLSQAGPRLKSRSVEANPLFDRKLDEAAPLNEFIDGLRQKYVDLEAKYKQDIQSLEHQVEEERQKALTEAARAKTLEARLEDVPAQREAAKKKADAESLEFHRQLEAQQQQLSELGLDLQARSEELSSLKYMLEERNTTISELQAQKARLSQELKEAQANFLSPVKAQEREKVIGELSAELQERKKELRYLQDELSSVRTSEKKASDSRWKLEQDLDSARQRVRELEANLKTSRDEASSCQTTATNLRKRLEELEALEKRWRTKHDDIVAESSTLLKDARVQAELYKRQVDEAVGARKRAEQEVQRLEKANSYLESEQKTLQASLAAAQKELDDYKKATLASTQDATEKQALYKYMENKERKTLEELEELQAKNDSLTQELEKAVSETDLLRQELEAKSDMSAIRMEEFEELRRTNEELAATIGRLTARFSRLGHSAQDYERRGYELGKEQKLARMAKEAVGEQGEGPERVTAANKADEAEKTGKTGKIEKTEKSGGSPVKRESNPVPGSQFSREAGSQATSQGGSKTVPRSKPSGAGPRPPSTISGSNLSKHSYEAPPFPAGGVDSNYEFDF